MIIKAQPLTRAAFAPFGQVLEHAPDDAPRRNFAAELFNDRSSARANLRVQRSEPVSLPHIATVIERHRRSSQMFVPLSGTPYLVVVFPSAAGGVPLLEQGRAFAAHGNQGINYNRDVWHHGFLALETAGTFLMLRWEDGTSSDEEFLPLATPISIEE